jgi:putative mRNA 3-end processing factor
MDVVGRSQSVLVGSFIFSYNTETPLIMKAPSLITFTKNGIYCEAANVYIDPWKPVKNAIITHAHSDHARVGMENYLAHKDSQSILKLRLGKDINVEAVEYDSVVEINNVKISLHPAGHILGSAQVRLEKDGEVWVVSGDYKLQNDNVSPEFQPVPCQHFITESTFGLPVYKWTEQKNVMNEINEWWRENRMTGKCSVLMGYALGKMQRIIRNLEFEGPVYCHGAIYNVNESFRKEGFDFPRILSAGTITDKSEFRNALILAPTSALNSTWMKKFFPYSVGYCSGWMAIRGAKNRRGVDRGFVLSDHADWNELNVAVKETGAGHVYVTHGYTSVFSKWLNENGIASTELKTQFGEEDEEDLNAE